MKVNGTLFRYHDNILVFEVNKYAVGGRKRIDLYINGYEPYATLSVNIPSEAIENDEFFAKTWSENEDIAKEILSKSKLFMDTGRSVRSGFVEAPIWKLHKNVKWR